MEKAYVMTYAVAWAATKYGELKIQEKNRCKMSFLMASFCGDEPPTDVAGVTSGRQGRHSDRHRCYPTLHYTATPYLLRRLQERRFLGTCGCRKQSFRGRFLVSGKHDHTEKWRVRIAPQFSLHRAGVLEVVWWVYFVQDLLFLLAISTRFFPSCSKFIILNLFPVSYLLSPVAYGQTTLPCWHHHYHYQNVTQQTDLSHSFWS